MTLSKKHASTKRTFTCSKSMCKICSKLTIKLTLERFHILFWCFHCWLWMSTCRLGREVLSFLKKVSFIKSKIKMMNSYNMKEEKWNKISWEHLTSVIYDYNKYKYNISVIYEYNKLYKCNIRELWYWHWVIIVETT